MVLVSSDGGRGAGCGDEGLPGDRASRLNEAAGKRLRLWDQTTEFWLCHLLAVCS